MIEAREIGGLMCVVADADGDPIGSARDLTPLIEAAFEHRGRILVLPVERLDPAFFQIRSGVAGDVLQKATQYRTKVAVVGDITAHVAASDALRDFVVECDRGDTVFFAPDMDALERQLASLTVAPD
jgi:hypothetical protein